MQPMDVHLGKVMVCILYLQGTVMDTAGWRAWGEGLRRSLSLWSSGGDLSPAVVSFVLAENNYGYYPKIYHILALIGWSTPTGRYAL